MTIGATIAASIGGSMSPPWLNRADPYGRRFLLDAATGLVLPGFAYSRSGPALWLPQQDGTLSSFGPDVLPRSFGVGGWGYEFHPGWTQGLLHTNALSNAVWTPVAINAPTQDGATFGGSASWGIVESSDSAYRYISQGFSWVSGTTYTARVLVSNRVGSRFVQLRLPGAAFGGVALVGSFNPRTGAAQSLSAGLAVHSEQVSGGWIFSVTATATATATAPFRVQLAATQSVADEIYQGDGVSGVNVWGVNLTTTSYPVPLTVATTAPGTIGTHTMGATLSALWITLGNEYGVGVESVLNALVPNYQPISISISDSGFNESIYQNAATLTANREPNWAVIDGGVGQANSMGLGPATVVGQLRKTAMRVKANDFRSAFNGALTLADQSGTLPTVDRVFIGLNWSGTSPNAFQGRITRAYLIPSRAPSDAELAAMTA